jgi:hypothetical protein
MMMLIQVLLLLSTSLGQQFPYPIHFNLPPSHEVRLEPTLLDSVAPKDFRVAIILAGEIRSFFFVEKSWRRAFIDEWIDNIFFFAHVGMILRFLF